MSLMTVFGACPMVAQWMYVFALYPCLHHPNSWTVGGHVVHQLRSAEQMLPAIAEPYI